MKIRLSASAKQKKPFAQQGRIAFSDTPQQTKTPAQSSVRGFDVQMKFAGIQGRDVHWEFEAPRKTARRAFEGGVGIDVLEKFENLRKVPGISKVF